MKVENRHTLDFIVAAISLLGEYLALRFGIEWLPWIAAFFFCLALIDWTKGWHSLSPAPKYGIRIFLILFVAAITLWLTRQKIAAASQQQSSPHIEQKSDGNNSPNTNIIGNDNTVNIGDPKVSAKLDEITKLLKTQQGDQVSPKNLLAKYPLGYTIFEVDYMNSVYPYESHALDNWDFDWTVVRLKDTKLPGTNTDMLMLRLPDIRQKGGGLHMTNANVGQPKKLGPFGGGLLRNDGIFDMKAEILAIKDNGIVFLIGFARPTP